MRNITPESGNNGNMPASEVCISNGQARPNQGQINGQIKVETNPSIICCNSELAKSFQVLKDPSGNVTNPGYYFQKALNNVTINSRSQSLPSCLETKKTALTIPISNKLELKPIKVPEKFSNDSWFRTWPERGNEKFLLTPNNNSDLPHHPNNTEHKPDCDNALTRYSSNEKCIESNTKCSAIPLSELLENIPLAYSPVTRQLHLINRNESQETIGKCRPVKESDVNRDLLRPLESIEEDLDENAESPRSTLHRTDASSFSSIVSSLSDISPSTTEEDFHGSRGRDSRSSGDGSSLFEDTGAKPKRSGLSGFFTRSVFGWKSQSSSPNSSPHQGWKLFGNKTPTTIALPSDEDYEPRCDSPCSIRSDTSASKKYEDVVASSSALILHNRPASLPAKSQDEEAKHRQEYEQMVEAARKKELKEAKCRKKQLQQQLKFEEQLAAAARVWNLEILPKWDLMRNSRKARDLWWRGLPPAVRGKVWRLAIANDLNVTRQLYEICAARAQDRLRACNVDSDVASNDSSLANGPCDAEGMNMDKESSVELIQLDIARTFPHLCIFQKGGPCYDMIHSLLGAYACYRPDVGYVQGMSFIAAVLILNLDVADAFVCFANLLNRPCHMAFFRLNQTVMQAYYATYNEFFRENLPRLFQHFSDSSLTPDLYLLDWIYTVFAKAMPLDVASRVWDVFLRDGEEFLFRAALGILLHKQDVLLQKDFLHGAQFLTKLPDDLSADELFKSIEAIRMSVGKCCFTEVLARHVDQCREPS